MDGQNDVVAKKNRKGLGLKDKLLATLRLTALQILVSVLLAAVLTAFFGDRAWKSTIYGGLFFAASLLLSGISWGLIFSKKYIALAIALSVFKLSILVIILYDLIVNRKVVPEFFVMGCAIFVIPALIEAGIAIRGQDQAK